MVADGHDPASVAPRDLNEFRQDIAGRAGVEDQEGNRPFTEPRRAVIAGIPALQERVPTKTASLTRAVSAALEGRGVDDDLATLAAQVGMTAFGYVARACFDSPKIGLTAHLERALQRLRELSPTGVSG